MLMLDTLTGPTRWRVRPAIDHAIDRDLIVEALLKAIARSVDEADGAGEFRLGGRIEGFDYDPAAASRCSRKLASRGTKVTFPTGPFFDQRVVQAIQQMLADVS